MVLETYRYGDAFSCGTGYLINVQGIMEKEDYIRIFDRAVEQSAENFKLGDNWKYQRDNDPSILLEK